MVPSVPLLRTTQAVPRAELPPLTPRRVIEWIAPALSARRRRRIDAVVVRRLASVTVLLEGVHDPHNLAAVVRSCEAFGLLHLHVVPDAEQGFSLSRRVTQSADKWIDIYVHEDAPAALSFLRRSGFTCWAALPPPLQGKRRVSRGGVVVDRPLALVLGNEHAGLSTAARALCSERFHLPMYGFTESFNVSVSAALALQDAVERRRAHLGREGDLPDEARERLRATYYARSVRHAPDLVLRAARDALRGGR